MKQTDTVQTLLDEAESLVGCDIKQNLSRFSAGEDVSWFGLAVGASVRIRFGSPLSSKVVVCGHCIVTVSLTIMKH